VAGAARCYGNYSGQPPSRSFGRGLSSRPLAVMSSPTSRSGGGVRLDWEETWAYGWTGKGRGPRSGSRPGGGRDAFRVPPTLEPPSEPTSVMVPPGESPNSSSQTHPLPSGSRAARSGTPGSESNLYWVSSRSAKPCPLSSRSGGIRSGSLPYVLKNWKLFPIDCGEPRSRRLCRAKSGVYLRG
jgi:hypothetical protein